MLLGLTRQDVIGFGRSTVRSACNKEIKNMYDRDGRHFLVRFKQYLSLDIIAVKRAVCLFIILLHPYYRLHYVGLHISLLFTQFN